jgi:subtilisin family serine protease
VAAVDRNGEPARFSNRGDMWVRGNGVATLGGDADPPKDGEPAHIEVDDKSRAVDGIAGIFSSEQLPYGGGTNETGWVYWAGTSFATPIISAIAANVWAHEPDLRPRQVIDRVMTFTTGKRNASLDCPVIHATQD